MPLSSIWGLGRLQHMRKRRSEWMGGRPFIRAVAILASTAAAGIGVSALAVEATATTARHAVAPAAPAVPQVIASTSGGGATVTLSGPATAHAGSIVRLHLDVRG